MAESVSARRLISTFTAAASMAAAAQVAATLTSDSTLRAERPGSCAASRATPAPFPAISSGTVAARSVAAWTVGPAAGLLFGAGSGQAGRRPAARVNAAAS
jgi:hypothetical protein